MAKRRKIIYAGAMVYECIYSAFNPCDPAAVQKSKRRMSRAAIDRMNCSSATRKLELRMAAAFALDDLVITLTYDEDHLPDSYAGAAKCLNKFLRQLRAVRKARGQELYYIYVSEGKHGDHRLHHHVIINATGTDYEDVNSLWVYGRDTDFATIGSRGGYHGYRNWAVYLSKERREASLNGKRMFVPSKNLPKPEAVSEWADDATSIETPPGAFEITSAGDRDEYASYKYIVYVLPSLARAVEARNLRAWSNPITSRHGCRNGVRGLERGIKRGKI